MDGKWTTRIEVCVCKLSAPKRFTEFLQVVVFFIRYLVLSWDNLTHKGNSDLNTLFDVTRGKKRERKKEAGFFFLPYHYSKPEIHILYRMLSSEPV